MQCEMIKESNGGIIMLGRLMAPAIRKMAAMNLNNFIGSIVSGEQAIRSTILYLKNDLFNGLNGGLR